MGRWPRWLPFALGAVTGVVVTTLVAVLVVPLFDDPTDLEPGDLVILSGRDQSEGRQRQELVNQWNQLHPRNRARIDELPVDADSQYAEMVGQAQSPAANADVYNLDVAWTAKFADAGWIRELDESVVDTSGFIEQPLGTCRWSGKLWALPFNTDAGLLYYRDPVGRPPVSWDALVQETRRVFAEPRAPQLVAGYTAQLADYEGLVVNALEAIWAADGEVVDRDGSVVIGTPEAETGLRRLAEGLQPADPQVILPEATSQDEVRSMQAFGEGKVLFMRHWPVAYRNLLALASDDKAQQPFFKVAKLPGPSVLGGQNLAVASKSTKPRAARALIEFLTGARSQQILFERGGLAATRQVVYEDAEVQRQRPYAKVLLEAIRNARPRPISAHYGNFAKAFRAVVREALADGGRIPPDAVARLTAALRGE